MSRAANSSYHPSRYFGARHRIAIGVEHHARNGCVSSHADRQGFHFGTSLHRQGAPVLSLYIPGLLHQDVIDRGVEPLEAEAAPLIGEPHQGVSSPNFRHDPGFHHRPVAVVVHHGAANRTRGLLGERPQAKNQMELATPRII